MFDHLAHDPGRFGRSGGGYLARRRLDVTRSGCHREETGLGDILGGLQRAHFQDDLEVGLAGRRFHLGYLVVAGLVVPREELTLRQHDVNVGGTGSYGKRHFGHLDLNEGLRCGETAGYGCDAHAIGGEQLFDGRHQGRIGADGGHVLQTGILVGEVIHLSSHLGQFFFGVIAIEAGQLNHAEQTLPYGAFIVFVVMCGEDFLYIGFHLFFGVSGSVLCK